MSVHGEWVGLRRNLVGASRAETELAGEGRARPDLPVDESVSRPTCVGWSAGENGHEN
jgi:hypothetical protein